MARERIDLISRQMQWAYEEVWNRVQGISEEEYFWEPVPGCWTVYPTGDGKWTYHYDLPAPEPHPLTTIAWRVVHITLCKVMYHEYAFGPGELDWMTIETPPSMAETLAELERGQKLLVDDLASLREDRELDVERLANWGEMMPTWRLFWILIHHDAHHGGEIGSLRDLYLHTQGGRVILPAGAAKADA